MVDWTFIHQPWFGIVAIPILIFLARVIDVTLDTMRIIFLNRGHKIAAPLLGFVQVLIWVTAIAQVLQNLSQPMYYVAYSAGFATGNYVGILIEEKVAAGILALRVVTDQETSGLVAALRQAGHGVTLINGHGARGSVDIVFVVIRRKTLDSVVKMIHRYVPKAFYSTEEVRKSGGGVMAAGYRRREIASVFRSKIVR
jgi:uncharacterized protein YebE (UPF0316 family)